MMVPLTLVLTLTLVQPLTRQRQPDLYRADSPADTEYMLLSVRYLLPRFHNQL